MQQFSQKLSIRLVTAVILVSLILQPKAHNFVQNQCALDCNFKYAKMTAATRRIDTFCRNVLHYSGIFGVKVIYWKVRCEKILNFQNLGSQKFLVCCQIFWVETSMHFQPSVKKSQRKNHFSLLCDALYFKTQPERRMNVSFKLLTTLSILVLIIMMKD